MKIGITTDCVCDLPEKYISQYRIGLIHFDITTDTGCFKDREEITSHNVIEAYRAGAPVMISDAPSEEAYLSFFQKQLRSFDEIIHITISSGISHSYERAAAAAQHLEGKVFVLDSLHLSTGIGLLVLRACELRNAGKSTQEILEEISALREHVVTTFMVTNTEYLYRNQKMSSFVNKLCTFFRWYPVLEMKQGMIHLHSMRIGNIQHARRRYVRSMLRRSIPIFTDKLFITHAGCKYSEVEMVRNEVIKKRTMDEIIVSNASATVTVNCGEGTLGIIYMRLEK
ncbi:MAG: DegV family EDD domain-containing protein [Oscillospiraceae bacterium]|nr:DegV family EDD domain-containing protein [Oscillospiraceae bacterium]